MSALDRIINELPDLIPIIFDYFVDCNNVFHVTNFKFICKKVFELTHNHFWFQEFKKTFQIMYWENHMSCRKKIIVIPDRTKFSKKIKGYIKYSIHEYLMKLSHMDTIIFKNLLLDSRIYERSLYEAFMTSCRNGKFNNVKIILDMHPNLDIHRHEDSALWEPINYGYINIIELLIVTSFKQKNYYDFKKNAFYTKRITFNYPIIYKKIIEIYKNHGIDVPFKDIDVPFKDKN
jgi:hypothetical protein